MKFVTVSLPHEGGSPTSKANETVQKKKTVVSWQNSILYINMENAHSQETGFMLMQQKMNREVDGVSLEEHQEPREERSSVLFLPSMFLTGSEAARRYNNVTPSMSPFLGLAQDVLSLCFQDLDSWRWTFTHPCSQAALFTTAKI
jgi:hypothetical protein